MENREDTNFRDPEIDYSFGKICVTRQEIRAGPYEFVAFLIPRCPYEHELLERIFATVQEEATHFYTNYGTYYYYKRIVRE